MYPLCFFICLVVSIALVTGLVLLAVYPIKLPIARIEYTSHKLKRSKPPPRKVLSYWDDWDNDEDDL